MTYNDGCLGSRNDEERSEMRYVMRIAESVNHQIFERTLHFFFEEVLLFECLFSPIIEFLNGILVFECTFFQKVCWP